jgi:hypothetical protein
MWAMFSGVPAGNPDKFTTKVTDTGPVKVPLAIPRTVERDRRVAPATGHDSCDRPALRSESRERRGNTSACWGVVDGDVDDFEQPAGNEGEGDGEQGQAFHLILLSRTCG